MKISSIFMIILSSSVLVFGGCIGSKEISTTTINTSTGIQSQVNISSLNELQKTTLLYLIQEEKLARDIYSVMYDTRGIKKFSNILNAEENHQEAVANILKTYNIKDPTNGTNPGQFADTELQALYTTLVTQGKANESEAIKVGIAIEEKDIKDIQDMIGLFDGYPDIQSVLQRLLEGSQKHLTAFSKSN